MTPIAQIEDALIVDIKANIAGIRTAATLETDFDQAKLLGLMPKAPFALIRYGRLTPVEGERYANNASGMKREEFDIALGAQSLRSVAVAQRGAYDLIDAIRARYDGFSLSVSGDSITLSLESVDIIFSGGGLVVYSLVLSFFEN